MASGFCAYCWGSKGLVIHDGCVMDGNYTTLNHLEESMSFPPVTRLQVSE